MYASSQLCGAVRRIFLCSRRHVLVSWANDLLSCDSHRPSNPVNWKQHLFKQQKLLFGAEQQQLAGVCDSASDTQLIRALLVSSLAGTGSQLHTIRMAKGVSLGKVPKVGPLLQTRGILNACGSVNPCYTNTTTQCVSCWLPSVLLAHTCRGHTASLLNQLSCCYRCCADACDVRLFPALRSQQRLCQNQSEPALSHIQRSY
jgi:hypothetical protein